MLSTVLPKNPLFGVKTPPILGGGGQKKRGGSKTGLGGDTPPLGGDTPPGGGGIPPKKGVFEIWGPDFTPKKGGVVFTQKVKSLKK